ncbi:NAD(P)-dependent alcohol dehydrogenase [Luteipulveratus mongoliensis]|uniref:Alcohol dehydrogenase n=1 Tax=Luteipulveratus mongoliensis TaxID=571913 RepID=A0A0K1JDV2_9MICO|nr:NAD(P)-dependent alcohol dehydrogenase [Luteipulveratus mongoliensis]AKU14884.1 alcohol dehydrogenase [Luteipulveratus mongoliensis]
MKAAVSHRYGPPDVVRIEDVPTPTPAADQVLVRVHSAAVTIADARIRGSNFPAGMTAGARLVLGVRRPRLHVLGSAFSGVVDAVGTDVTAFAAGDEVCGMTPFRMMGAHAEYVVAPTARVVRKPADVTHDDAAGVLFGGTTALGYLRGKAAVRRGQSVLVNGASGAVGTNAVQLAKRLGARVTALTSAPNAALVASLGADRVIDYAATPLAEITDRFDVIIDTVGNVSPAAWKALLAHHGVLLLVVANLVNTIRARGNVKTGTVPERAEEFEELLRLVASGELTVVIDQVLPLDQIVAAHERVDSGHKVGNLIVHPPLVE